MFEYFRETLQAAKFEFSLYTSDILKLGLEIKRAMIV